MEKEQVEKNEEQLKEEAQAAIEEVLPVEKEEAIAAAE